MAPWTGKLIQSNLEKLTAHNIDEVAAKLINLLETRTQVQKLALLVSQRIQRAYTPTFHQPFDEKRRHIADCLVASLLRCFASLRKPLKGVPTKDGLSGIPLFKADLLGAAVYEKTGIGAVATSLYNTLMMSCQEVKTIIIACLDSKYAGDADKVGEAILLLEYAAREIEQENREAIDKVMEVVKERLDGVSVLASERKTCGIRLIPSLYDRYWDLCDKRKDGWRQSPYALSDSNSSTTAAAAAAAATKEDELLKAIDLPRDASADDRPPTPDAKSNNDTQQMPWPSGFDPVDASLSRQDSDAKINGVMSPITKETQQSTTSLVSTTKKPRKRCPSCSREAIPAQTDDEYARVAYGQAMGYPEQAREESNPTLTFDDEDDPLTLHLDVQAGSPLKVKFDADTRLGDAKRIAKLLAASLNMSSTTNERQILDSNTTSSPPIQFLSDGRVGQILTGPSINDIFVQYPHAMTLLQARQIGDSLAGAVDSYTR